MFQLIMISLSFLPQDSLQKDTILLPSVLFIKRVETSNLKSFKYQYKQGKFCDFEDRISKNKKMFINLGVGE